MKSLIILFATTVSLTAVARPVELDILRCRVAQPLTFSSTTPEGTSTHRIARSFSIYQNLNKNYATILVNGRDVGSDNYSRGRAGSINTSGWNTDLTIRLRPVRESGTIASNNVALAYAEYTGTANGTAVSCNLRITTSN